MIANKKKRGRPAKKDQETAPTIDLKPPFKCSACEFINSKLNLTERHILTEHYGQALINENRSLTEYESTSNYRKAIKLLKKLKCLLCEKNFKSFLGYKFHVEICGKEEDELYVECEICGKKLKKNSLSVHIKMLHSINETIDDSFDEKNSNLLDTILDSDEKNQKKRTSAIKALGYFKLLTADEDDKEIVERKPKLDKKRKWRNSEELDADFKMDDNAINHQSDEEFDSDEEENEESISEEEHIDEETCDDNQNDNTLLSTHQLEESFSVLWSLIERTNDHKTLATIECQVEQENSIDFYPCYNKFCKARFRYRVLLENHSRKCLNSNHGFRCRASPECQFHFKMFNFQALSHFFRLHKNLIPKDIIEKCNNFFKKTSHSVNYVKKLNYFERMVEMYKENSNRPLLYQCLKPSTNDFKIIDDNFSPGSENEFPQFKSTNLMDSGINEFFSVNPLDSLTMNKNSIVLNVGQWVTAVSWCPLPLAFYDSESNTQTNFEKLVEAQSSWKHDQFIVIATSSFDDFLNSRQSSFVSLQFWNLGLLKTNKKVESLEDDSRIALNCRLPQEYGDVLELVWCPFGCTFQNDDSFKRLGLLAFCTEDGCVRILSVPMFDQIPGAYDKKNLFEIIPKIVLRHRFSSFQNCNTIAWNLSYPFDLIAGGYNDGHVCLWRLNDFAKCDTNFENECLKHEVFFCETQKQFIILPWRMFSADRCNPLLSLKWISPHRMFVCGFNSSQTFDFRYEGIFYEINNRYQMVEVHPLWKDSYLLLEDFLQKRCSWIGKFALNPFDEFLNNYKTTLVIKDVHFYSMSLSPWMYVLAFCTDNGKLFTTNQLRDPKDLNENSQIFKLSDVRLGYFSEKDIDPETKNGNLNADKKTSINKNNILVDECLNLEHSLEDFTKKYFFIFNDNDQPENLLRRKAKPNEKFESQMLTKNDLYRFYSITNCLWNPNFSSYGWIFTATKCGLCRLNHFPVNRPDKI